MELTNVSARAAVVAAFEILSSMQTKPKDLQVDAAAVLLILLSKKHKADIRKVLEIADNMMIVLQREQPETYRAILAYIDGELS